MNLFFLTCSSTLFLRNNNRVLAYRERPQIIQVHVDLLALNPRYSKSTISKAKLSLPLNELPPF